MSPRLSRCSEQRRLEVLRHRIDRLRDADRRRRLPLEVDRRRVVQHLARQLRRSARGIVALKNSVCRFAAADVRSTRRMSGRKPMSSMRSASSSTRYSRPRELRVRRAEVIEQPARRGDDDVHAAAERVLLRPHADAAEHGGGGERRVHGEVVEILENLRRQLARRRQHERARRRRAACSMSCAGSAAGTPRSCRCRSWRRRAGRAPRAPAESRRPESASAG